MENQKVSPLKTALRMGLIIGLIFIVLSLITFLLDMEDNKTIRYLDIVIIIGGVVWAIKSHRDNDLGGFISYGRGLGIGTLSILFASIILAVYMIIYFNTINPGAIEMMEQLAEERMIEQGMEAEDMEEAMKYTRMFMTPPILAAGVVLWTTVIGFVVSLIASAVFQRKSPTLQE